MKINFVQHIAINTKNIEESIDFYQNILGFEKVSAADMGDVVLVYMKVDDNTLIELFDLKGNNENGITPENRLGLRHIAFDVDNLLQWNEFLKSKNVPFELEVTELPEIKKRALLVKDPNGTVVELCEDL